MFAFVVLALVASVSANVYFDSKCPEYEAVENFNLSSVSRSGVCGPDTGAPFRFRALKKAFYGNGIWYQVARYPNSAEKKSNCGYGEYKLEGDIFKIKNSYVSEKKRFFIEGYGKVAENAGNTGVLVFSLPYGISGKNTDTAFKILDTDYDNYAINYYCKYDEERKSRQDFAWVLSRSKVLSPEIKMKVENFMKESKFLYSSKFWWSDFSDEVCNV